MGAALESCSHCIDTPGPSSRSPQTSTGEEHDVIDAGSYLTAEEKEATRIAPAQKALVEVTSAINSKSAIAAHQVGHAGFERSRAHHQGSSSTSASSSSV